MKLSKLCCVSRRFTFHLYPPSFTLPLMPRFSMKWMLAAFALIAVWCSSVAHYPAASDVRRFIVLLTVAACFVLTYCSPGRRKCFWIGFTVLFFIATFSQQLPYPAMHWVTLSVRPLVTSIDIYGDVQTGSPSIATVQFFADTINLAVDCIFATLAGFIGTTVYDYSRTHQQS
jgi:hypothetical protein